MNDSTDPRSTAMPDPFDRKLAALHENPEVVKTKPSTIQEVPLMGVGGASVFIVQSYRDPEKGDVISLQVASATGNVRIMIPPRVANCIARQREALSTKLRSKIAKARAEDLKAQGIQPGFMRTAAK